MSLEENCYRLWAGHTYFDADTRAELAAIADNAWEVKDRFHKSLEFGTGGLRALIGAGTNRMNRYMVRLASRGLADHIPASERHRGVVIAYDSRRLSAEFAREAALTLNAAGIPAYLWDSLRPTPMLSFAVRELRAIAGVVVTASHNPPEYNGYKVYWEDGGQVPPDRASAIQACMRSVTDLTTVQPMPTYQAIARGLLRPVPSTVDRAYYDRLETLTVTTSSQRQDCRILYTPLHGAGSLPVRRALTEAGYLVDVVKAQELPDPGFSTVRAPNPEEPAVFAMALQQAAVTRPDVIMATDPDADRLGVAARDRQGRYRLLTGNQIGALLVDFLLSTRPLPANGAIIKTIATSNLIAPLCQTHGVTLLNVHTGFKFVGDKIREFEATGSHTFLFGMEESYGYLGATFVRDKDAVMSALLMAEATAYHRAAGRTLYDALQSIWQRCGCFQEDLHTVHLPGLEGEARIAQLMDRLRQEPPAHIGHAKVAFADDYLTGRSREEESGQETPLALGRANVLHYRFADGGFVMVRPSGTESKLKLYVSVSAADLPRARRKLRAVKAATLRMLEI